jgi:hypothetical protein
VNEFDIVTVINRPAAEVFAFVADPTNIPLYNSNVTEARLESPEPLAIGSTMALAGHFLGRRYETTWEVTDLKENEVQALKTVSGPFYLELTTRYEEVDGGTRVSSHYRGESRGFFKLAEPVVIRVTKKQFESAAQILKELLEADETA